MARTGSVLSGTVRTVTAAIAAAVMLVLMKPAMAEDVSFDGKVVRIVVNLGVASGLAAHHQVFAPFVGKHLPGEPKIIVEPKPGGAGILGADYLARSVRPDGETAGSFAIISGNAVTGQAMPVDLRDFVYIGSMGQGTLVYVREDSGIRTVDDLLDPANEPLIATSGPNASIQLQLRLFLNALGLEDKYRVFSGYQGMLGQLQAVRSGEVNMALLHADQHVSRLDSFKEEGIIPIAELGLPTADGKTVTTSGLGVPTVHESWLRLAPDADPDLMGAFEVAQVSKAISWIHVLPPGTDEKYRAVWERAFAAAAEDPEYLKLLKEQGSAPTRFTDGATTAQMVGRMIADSENPRIRAAIDTVTMRR